MSVLGRGLASLIPSRRPDADLESEDLIDQLDTMEDLDEDGPLFAESEELVSASTQSKGVSVKVSAEQSFPEELEESESDFVVPEKPKTTPLEFDAKMKAKARQEIKAEAALEVKAVADEDLLFDLSDDEDEEVLSVQSVSTTMTVVNKKQVETAGMSAKAVHAKSARVFVSENKTSLLVNDVKKAEPVKQEVADVVSEDVIAPSFGDVGSSDGWNKHEEKIVHIPIGDVRINPLQPRRQFAETELDELRDSIERHGILQPLVVRRLPKGEDAVYELIAGERRLRASKSLQWDRVPCVVRKDVHSDQSRLVYALIENIQRQNLNPIEEALAYQQLNKEYGLTHEEIGERVGKSRVAVTNALRVLQLPAEIQRGLSDGKISIGHAKAILMIPDEEKQVRFYRHLVEEGVTVRKAEIRARRIQRSMNVTDPTRIKRAGLHPMALRYSPPLEDRFGYGAKIKFNEEKNRFDVRFEAYSEKDLEELVGRLMGVEELPDHDRDVVDRDGGA